MLLCVPWGHSHQILLSDPRLRFTPRHQQGGVQPPQHFHFKNILRLWGGGGACWGTDGGMWASILRVGQNRIYGVYIRPYICWSHRIRIRIRISGFTQGRIYTAYKPYIYGFNVYIPYLQLVCRVRFPATAVSFALFGQVLFSRLFLLGSSFASLFYWCICFCINN